MKKLVLLIVALLLVSIMAVHAEGIDLSGMSDNELKVLFEEVKTEISSRGLTRSGELGHGSYVVGKDIAAGTYTISTKEMYAWYTVFPSEEVFSTFTNLSKEISIRTEHLEIVGDDTSTLLLNDGNVLVLEHNVSLKEQANSLMP